jgi:HD-GYP domain-containing protein (c-di-GMP phosphodiesterase class II)
VTNIKEKSYFSVSMSLICVDKPMPYNLYINSSAHANRERFVRIFAKDRTLSRQDLEEFKQKYFQLYVSEEEREAYLRSLVDVDGVPDKEKAEVIKDSAIVYLGKIFDETHEFTNEVLDETIEGCRESVASMIGVVKDYDTSDVQYLIAELSFHDFYTFDHSINVSMYSISIFKALKPNATDKELTMAGLGGLLHDLGKVKIPTRIINNPGKLSDEDFDIIKQHPGFGDDLLKEQCERGECDHEGIDFEIIRRVVHEHHENYNGSGYPNKLKEGDIHVYARIVAIADFYDAITTKRSYHEVLGTKEALELMAKSVGKKLDPKIFDVFVKSIDVVLEGKGAHELPESFDPCQPQNVLPFERVKPKVQRSDFTKNDDKKNFGKIKKG